MEAISKFIPSFLKKKGTEKLLKAIFKKSLVLMTALAVIFSSLGQIAYAVAINAASKTDVAPGTQFTTFKGAPVFKLNIANSGDAADTITTLSPTPSGSAVDTKITLHFFKDVNNNGIVDQGDVDLGASAAFTGDDTKQTFDIADVAVPSGGSVSILITADGLALADTNTFTLGFALAADIAMTVTPVGSFALTNANALTASSTAPAVTVANGGGDSGAPRYAAASATNVVTKQIAVTAAAGTSDSIVSIAPTPSGTGNDNAQISSVVFYIDSGSVPGQVDGTDIQLVSTPATFSANDTKTTFTFSNPVQITQGTTTNILVVYNIGASAANGTTFIQTIAAAGDVAAGSTTAVTKTATVSATVNIDNAPSVSSAAAYTDRIIVNFSENVDGMQASNCANYTVGGSVVVCSGPGTPFIDFQGNKATIRGLSLSGTTTLAIAGSAINDIDGPQNALAAYSSGSLTVNTLTLPAITNINPTSGAVGASITITGTSFGTGTAGDSDHKVFFSGGFSQSTGPLPPIEADYTGASWSETSISVKVPAGAQGGPVNVMVSGVMSDMSSYSFFDIAGSYAAKVYYSADNATPMLDGDAGNIRIVTAGMGGLTVHKVGDGTMTYANGTPGTFTITGVSSMGGVWAFDATGAHLNSSGGPIDISATQNLRLLATTRKISGTLTIGASCVAGGQDKSLVVFAMPDAVDSGASGFKEMEPAVFVTGPANGQAACQTAYSIGVPVSGTYRVEAHIPPESSGGLTISSGFTDPSAQLVTITDAAQTATGKNFTFSAATHKIMGHIQKPASGSFGAEERNMLWAFAYQPQEGGKGTGTQIDASGNFTLFVTPGVWKVGISGPNMPSAVEIQVDVDSTYALASYTAATKNIVISPPSDFIEGYAKDAAGNGLSNTSIYAWREGGPGGGNATTDSQGYYKMYVTPGSGYHVGAQSQTYGFLGENSGITVSASAHPTVNFTVSSANNYTISGTILKGVVGLQQAFVFVTEGERGQMLGGGGTDSSGAYSIKVSGGENRYLHVGLPGKGEIYTENLGTVGANIPNKDVTINSSTIIVKISPASAVSQALVGAHSDQGGGFSNTDVSTDAGVKEYHIEVPQPASGTRTYYVEGGVPGYGPLTQIAVGVTSTGAFTETSGTANDGTIEYTLSDLYTVSGTITGTNTTDAWVWASGPNGGGGGSVSSNAYSIKLRNGTYDLGVSKPGYIGNKISITVNGANLPDQNLTLSSAAQTITGSVYLPDGTTKVTNAWVWAENGTGGWSGGSTDGNGDYTLNVGAGDWTVKAAYDGYNSNGRGVTAPSSSVNITLSAISGFAPNTQNSPITPSEGGVMQGTGIKVDLPKNVLGTGTTAATLELKSTTNAPSRASTNLIGSTQKEITARNGNQIVTTLSGSATVELTVSKADLVSEGLTLDQAKKMKISYFDSTSGGNWVEVPTAVTLSVPGAASISDLNDSVAITLSGTTSHFSTFAPTLPTSGDAPAAPADLSVGAGATSATLTWTAVSGATKYDIYQKSGDTYPYLAQTTQTSYTINGLSANVAYYFKVSALNDSNNESAATSAVSVVPGVAGQGGTTVTPTPTPTPTATPTPSATPVPTSTPTPSTTTGPATPAAPSGVTLYRASGDSRVYVIKDKKKQWIKTAEEFNAAGYKWSDISEVAASALTAYSDVSAALIRAAGDSKVYVVENGQKRWIETAENFNAAGYKWSDISEVAASALTAFPDAGAVIIKIISTSTLRVRQSNTTKSGILSNVKRNETYAVIEEKNGWYKIKTAKGITGWVSGAYAEKK